MYATNYEPKNRELFDKMTKAFAAAPNLNELKKQILHFTVVEPAHTRDRGVAAERAAESRGWRL